MPNITQVFKEEIARIARKQSRADMSALKKAVAKHRSDIAALKRQVGELDRALATARRGQLQPAAAAKDASEGSIRFSAKGFASHRKRLDLSATDLGRLFNVSGQTIYHWEAGKARPRARHMPAVAALRSLGRRQAAAVLASLG